jgi:hypothetical protein
LFQQTWNCKTAGTKAQGFMVAACKVQRMALFSGSSTAAAEQCLRVPTTVNK